MINSFDSRAACLTRVRFINEDGVVSLRLRATPTFGEVAWAMGNLAARHDAQPNAVDVRLIAPSRMMSDATGMPDAR